MWKTAKLLASWNSSVYIFGCLIFSKINIILVPLPFIPGCIPAVHTAAQLAPWQVQDSWWKEANQGVFGKTSQIDVKYSHPTRPPEIPNFVEDWANTEGLRLRQLLSKLHTLCRKAHTSRTGVNVGGPMHVWYTIFFGVENDAGIQRSMCLRPCTSASASRLETWNVRSTWNTITKLLSSKVPLDLE